MKLKTKTFDLLRSIFKIKFFENWLRNKTQGKSSNTFICKLVPNNYQYKNGSIRKFNYKGINLKVDINDYVGHYLYFGFEDIGQQKLIDLAGEGNTVLDIGTNVGSTLLQFAQKVGKKGKVFGFEPDKINFEVCQKNISLNDFENIEVAKIGLGNENKEFEMVVDTESNRGGNRIQFEVEKGKVSSKITVRKLDDWIKDKPISQIDLIKIDVEGFELKVLQGGIETIKKHKPMFFIELDDNNLKAVNDSAKELVSFLNELGYTSIVNAENNKPVSINDNFTDCHYDIVASVN